MTAIQDQLKSLLTLAFDPQKLEIVDETWHHQGHRESSNQPETHFKLVIVSSYFEGKSLLARHQAVYNAIQCLLENPIHALTMTVMTSAEYTLRHSIEI